MGILRSSLKWLTAAVGAAILLLAAWFYQFERTVGLTQVTKSPHGNFVVYVRLDGATAGPDEVYVALRPRLRPWGDDVYVAENQVDGSSETAGTHVLAEWLAEDRLRLSCTGCARLQSLTQEDSWKGIHISYSGFPRR